MRLHAVDRTGIAFDGARAKSVFVEICLVVLPLIAFFIYFDWLAWSYSGQVWHRGLGLAVGVPVSLLLVAKKRRVVTTNLIVALLGLVVLSLTVVRGANLIQAAQAPASELLYSDMAQTTMDAVDAVNRGENPYTSDLAAADAPFVPPRWRSLAEFEGYKYGPLMPILYLPGYSSVGRDGYSAANYVFLMATTVVAACWALSRGGVSAALGTAALVLLPDFLGFDLFLYGANDLVPVALLVAAFAARTARWPTISGILLGLSFGAKPVPAAVLAVPMLLGGESKKRFVVAASLTAAAIYLPWLLSSPWELISNVFLFHMVKPPEASSMLLWASPAVRLVGKLVSLAAAIGIPLLFRRWLANGHPARLAAAGAIATTALLLGSNQIHRHYLLWLLPLMAVAIATSLWSNEGVRGE